jgi:hypothetical protein
MGIVADDWKPKSNVLRFLPACAADDQFCPDVIQKGRPHDGSMRPSPETPSLAAQRQTISIAALSPDSGERTGR